MNTPLRTFYCFGEHTVCLQEISHFWTESGALTISMRNGGTLLPKRAGKSCYDLERELIEAIKDHAG